MNIQNNRQNEKDNLSQAEENSALGFDPKKEMEKKKRKRAIKKWIIRGVILLLLICVAAFTINFFSEKKEAEIPKTVTTAVMKRTIVNSLSGTGTLTPTNSYTINALVKGEILEAPFEEGDVIEEDALMFSIDYGSLDSNIERAELNVERAQNSYDELLESLEDMVIYSDWSGTVQKLSLEEGDKINAGSVIVQVLDSNTMICTARFFETDANTFNVGEDAILYFNSGEETLHGTVKEISALTSVNSLGAVVKEVEIAVANPGTLTPQSFATASVNGIFCNEGGNFTYNVNKNIISTASGEISKLNIKEGQWINKGDLVLTLDSSSINTQIKNSLLSLKDAKSSLQSVIDQKDDYNIKAPISGTVIKKNYEAGEVIDSTNGGNTLAVIYDMSALEFVLNVDELDISNISVGQQVEITSDAFKDKTYFGEVTKISIQGTSSNGTTSYPVTVTVKEAGELMPGMNIDAEIILERKENVISVPANAISRGNIVKLVVEDAHSPKNQNSQNKDGDNKNADKAVFADDGIKTMPDGTKYKEIQVELGVNDENYVEILSGLNEGDVVIVTEMVVSSSLFETIGNMHSGMAMGGGMPSGGGMPGGGRPGGR